MTGIGKAALKVILELILCIYYPVQFHKKKKAIGALINSNIRISVMTPAYAKNLGLSNRKTGIRD